MAKSQFIHPDGDHLTLLNVYHAYKSNEHDKNWAWNNYLSQRALQQADNVRTQLKRSMERFDLDLVSTPFEDKSYYVNIRKALTSGFFMQVAHKEGEKGNYLTIKDNQVRSPSLSHSLYLRLGHCRILTVLCRSSSSTSRAASTTSRIGLSSTSLF
jgi:pre-mRNA-splicing factor ATP-dependent RNA helicase DHX15/PRP43